MSVEIRKYYDYDARKVKGLDFSNYPSMTMQEFKEECDLNNIVDRNMHFKDPSYVTKMILAGKMSDSQPVYGDFVQVQDYQSAMNTVITAREQFAMLPSKVRDRFHNDPAEMLAFCNDLSNLDEGVSLGLYDASKVAELKASFSAGSSQGLDGVVQNAESTGAGAVSGLSSETST